MSTANTHKEVAEFYTQQLFAAWKTLRQQTKGLRRQAKRLRMARKEIERLKLQIIEPVDRGVTRREWLASQVDVSAYAPHESFMANYSRPPTIEEMAQYIAEIRLLEADAILLATKKKEVAR